MKLGIYKHYKGKLYEVIGEATHSETKEELVVYKMLYKTSDYPMGSIWVRPKTMFFEELTIEGKKVPRFKWISQKK